MYHPFIQFTVPKIGQALVSVLLYISFLMTPVLQPFAGLPLVYFGVPLLLLWLLSYISRNPLGSGMIFVAYLATFYAIGDIGCLLAVRIGGMVRVVWSIVYLWGATPWLLTVALLVWARHRALKLHVTKYNVTTKKQLPGGRLNIVQISDLHPGPVMNRSRITELDEKLAACNPDLLVFTGDIFDEYTSAEDFAAFTAWFATLTPKFGKYYVYGNHDLGSFWHTPCYDREKLEDAFAAANITVLEDTAVLTDTTPPLRIVGRKDDLFSNHDRLAPAALLPAADEKYTIWLDHEPLELKKAAAAGADVIFSGHTHAGQIWPAGLVAQLFRYNEMNYGCKQLTPGCTAIVTGGTGTWGYRIRTEGKTELVCAEVTEVK